MLPRPPQKKQQKKPNPFDTKVTKPKFDILNRDKLGLRGAPAMAKQRSNEIRRATLIPELKGRGKTSSFVDRRFGERDKSLSQEEKMLERFSRERMSGVKKERTRPGQSGKKKSIFNLDADEDYGDDSLASLTHLGQDVDKIEEFSDPEEGEFAHEKGLIDQRQVRHGHFGGYGDEENVSDADAEGAVPKTKAEVMKEVIAKSKFYKAERQKAREENVELCEELDQDFDSLRPTILANRLDRSKETREEDDYDAALKAMIFDKRSKPTDRTLTSEEARKKREEQIEAREARMSGRGRTETDDDSDASDNDNDNEDDNGKLKKKTGKKNINPTDTERDEQRATVLLDEFAKANSRDALTGPYARLVEMSQGPASVALGRSIRSKLSSILAAFKTEKRRPFYPGKASLMLFHLIGRLYSTSDFHHVIVSPASLLMAGFLETGRMTRPKHVISALFLAQTLLQYQRESKRVYPELFNLIHLLSRYISGDGHDKLGYLWDGPYNKLIGDRIKESLKDQDSRVEPTKLSFEDLAVEEKTFTPALARKIKASLLFVIKTASETYCDLPSFPEYFGPIQKITGINDALPTLQLLINSSLTRRKALTLQHHKPIALPMLNPDLGNDRDDRDQRDHSRLKAAYKREFKGAKREIRRDNEFLARHEAGERRTKDQEYRQMINRVMGTISNDAAGLDPKGKRRRITK